MHRLAGRSASPEEIYQVKSRPATAVASMRQQLQYVSEEVLREIPRPISAIAANTSHAAA